MNFFLDSFWMYIRTLFLTLFLIWYAENFFCTLKSKKIDDPSCTRSLPSILIYMGANDETLQQS